MPAGIEIRHARSCLSRTGGRCGCKPTFQAHVYHNRTGKRIRKTFPTKSAARLWRQDAIVALRHGTLSAPAPLTVGQALDALLAGMVDGTVLDRTGRPYKPATRRSYEQAGRKYIRPVLGDRRLTDLRRRDVPRFVDELRVRGLSASTIANKLDPLRVACRRAIRDEIITVDPTTRLELPAVRGRRDRIEAPERARELVQALPETERALWWVMLFAGLRRGEARALRWRDVDFDAGVLRVEATWDEADGRVEPKTAAGRRVVPIAGVVRRELAALKLRTGRDRTTSSSAALRRCRSPRAPRGCARGRPAHAARGAPLRRERPHRCRPEPEAAQRQHRTLGHPHDLRPLRTPDARRRGAGDSAA